MYTVDDINEKLKKLKMSDADLFNRQTTMTSDGKLHFQLGGEEYELNEDAFPKQSGGMTKTFDLLKRGFNDYSLSKKELEMIASKEFEIGDNVFRLEINPENPFDRRLIMQDALGVNPPQQVPLSAIQLEMVKTAHKGLGNTNEIK